jgi:hypothetical protein
MSAGPWTCVTVHQHNMRLRCISASPCMPFVGVALALSDHDQEDHQLELVDQTLDRPGSARCSLPCTATSLL